MNTLNKFLPKQKNFQNFSNFSNFSHQIDHIDIDIDIDIDLISFIHLFIQNNEKLIPSSLLINMELVISYYQNIVQKD